METNEGAVAYEHSLNHAVEFFSKAGSLFSGRESFYGSEDSALKLFQQSWISDKITSFKLLLWLRDCRGGAGNRSASREIYTWLAINEPTWIRANIPALVNFGRWDDLRSLFGTDLEQDAAGFWANAIQNNNVLAAKWADRKDRPIRVNLELKIGDFRRLLAKIRKLSIVEYNMCENYWHKIQYEHVPSVAMARYNKTFGKHDAERFEAYKNKLETGEVKIHAEVLFPHDCVRTVNNGDKKIADAQFNALPDYLDNAEARTMVISDTSASMDTRISGSISACDVSQALALYCSSRVPENSPFWKRFIGFCSESTFKDWRGLTFSQAVESKQIFDGAVGSTRIDTALDLILKIATDRDIPQNLMPTTLLIVSDMQFHEGVEGSETQVELSLKKWDAARYERPNIVYWDTAGYGGSQGTAKQKNIGLVSGFSPAILASIFDSDEFTPESVMLKTLEKYEIEVPE